MICSKCKLDHEACGIDENCTIQAGMTRDEWDKLTPAQKSDYINYRLNNPPCPGES